jgi:hypothetical protein
MESGSATKPAAEAVKPEKTSAADSNENRNIETTSKSSYGRQTAKSRGRA